MSKRGEDETKFLLSIKPAYLNTIKRIVSDDEEKYSSITHYIIVAVIMALKRDIPRRSWDNVIKNNK